MAMLEGSIYLWTGGHLLKYNSQDSLPITHTADANRVHTPFAEVPAGTFFAGITASDSSVFYFLAGSGTTHVYEYKFNAATAEFVGRPAWNPPQGFTCRQIAHSMGVIYLLGEYGDQVALFGMSVINREPLFLTYVGQQYGANGVTMTPRALAASYGAQVIMAVDDATTTYYFVYDAELDALSELDERTIASDTLAMTMTTFKNRRLAASGDMSGSGTTTHINQWKQDFDTPAGAWEWISAAGHLGYPMDEKLLFGFEVVQDPSISAGTVQVYYQIDESGSWVSVGTTVAGAKYTYMDLASSNIKFRTLRIKCVGASGARMFSVTARSYINSYQELWKLRLSLKDQPARTKSNLKAHQLRTSLISLVTARNSVTFLDGRRYPYSGGSGKGYTSHNVVVEFPRTGNAGSGILTRRDKGNLEGSVEVILRSTGRT